MFHIDELFKQRLVVIWGDCFGKYIWEFTGYIKTFPEIWMNTSEQHLKATPARADRSCKTSHQLASRQHKPGYKQTSSFSLNAS